MISVFENGIFEFRHRINTLVTSAVWSKGVSHSSSKSHAHKKEESQKEQHKEWSKK